MTPKFKIGEIIHIVPLKEMQQFLDENFNGNPPHYDHKRYLSCAGKIGKIMNFTNAYYDKGGMTVVYSIYIPEVPYSDKCIIPEALIKFPATKQKFNNDGI